MNKRILNLSIIAILLGGCAHDGEPLPEVVQIEKVSPYHKVSGDDTVGSIARKYGMKTADLIKLNNLEPPYQLYEGQRLVITPKVDNTQQNLQDQDVSVSKTQDMEETKVSEELNGEEIEKTETKDKSIVEDSNEMENEKLPATTTTTEYSWPIANGKEKISQHFDGNDGGIIIDASDGTPVKSIADGVVVISGVPNGEAAAYGTTVVVKHSAKKTMSIYANLKEASVKVKQHVKQGDIIGKVGQSGTIAKKPQLYFEVNDLAGKGRRAVDPEKLLG